MEKKSIEKLAKELIRIAKKAVHPKKASADVIMSRHDGVAYALPVEEARKFAALTPWLMREGHYAEVFSEEYVARKIKKLFADILARRAKDVPARIESLCNELGAYATQHTIYLCLDGVILEMPFSLGRVKLEMCTEELLSRILDDALRLIGKSKASSQEKKTLYEAISSELSQEMLWSCVARVEVVAEPSRAYERAQEEVRRVVDILRFSSRAIYPTTGDIRIGLRGDIPRAQGGGFICSEEGFASKGERRGESSVMPFEINKKTLRKMGEIGAIELADILNEDSPSDFKERLLRAVHWFSSAIVEQEIENAVVCLLMALETFFTQDGQDPNSDGVAEATAFLIADTLDERKDVLSTVKECYGVRSGIAHGGRKTVGSAALYNLLNIVGTVMLTLIEKTAELESRADLMNYIEDIKLS